MGWLGLFNYWVVIVLMMIGFYAVVARGNMAKKIMGLNLFQTSVFIMFISAGKINRWFHPDSARRGGSLLQPIAACLDPDRHRGRHPRRPRLASPWRYEYTKPTARSKMICSARTILPTTTHRITSRSDDNCRTDALQRVDSADRRTRFARCCRGGSCPGRWPCWPRWHRP